ncbi:MAG: pentapeptide repeat-containing protein [Microcoleus sp. SM1_3_4]|nr:pentapeptide repeat-containing protein [Microcoleus sp. SM1_3_4]
MNGRFFDVADRIFPLDRASDPEVDELENHFLQTPFYVAGTIEKTCKWFCHWEKVKNLPRVSEFTLPDPYEPLIVMYERGGIFSTEHGFFVFAVGSFHRGKWQQYDKGLPLLELDLKTLDEIDLYADDDAKLSQLIALNNIKQGVAYWNQWRKYHDVFHPNFSGKNFSGKDFTGADFSGAIFDNANLSHTNFQEAILDRATFTNANLTGANFTKADITGAVLSGASDRSTANFTDAVNSKEGRDNNL